MTNSLASASGAITVPMSRPSSTAPPACPAKARLPFEQGFSRTWLCTEASEAARPARLGLERRILQQHRLEIAAAQCIGRIGRIAAGAHHRHADRAVEQACVEMRQAIMAGERLGDGALARCRRAVDSDDHATSAPRPVISAMNPGKLVANRPHVVDYDRRRRDQPRHREAHRDAVVEPCCDRGPAGQLVAAGAVDDQPVFELLDPCAGSRADLRPSRQYGRTP